MGTSIDRYPLRFARRLVVVAATLAIGLAGCGDGEESTGSSTTLGGGSSGAPTSVGSSTTAGPAATAGGGATTSRPEAAFAYQPLWPFNSLDEAASWQKSYREGGHQPWHLDAGQTALSFANAYLGFTEIDRVTSSSTGSDGAHVGVGYPTEGDGTGTAAVVHLVRYGTGDDAPWEVVGTDDTDFTLTTPAYGAKVTSPVDAGGRITGVDEAIRLQVREGSADSLIGESCCLSAGGVNEAWHTTVTFHGATLPVLTVVASTGGHLQKVERFTVTGVRV